MAPVKGGALNNWLHEHLKTPGNLNVPMIAGLAAGGAAVASGAIALAVTSAKSKKKNGAKFLDKTPPPALGAGPAPAAGNLTAAVATAAAAVPAPAPAPGPMPRTVLAQPIHPGATTIEVASTAGLLKGDTILIDDEYNLIKGFSSIILDHPMNHPHASGAVVRVVHEPVVSQAVQQQSQQVSQALAGGAPAMQARAAAPPVAPQAVAAAAPLYKAAAAAATPAPTQTNVRTLFYIFLAGALICCLLFCIVAGLAIVMREKKRSVDPMDAYSGVGEGEAQGDESDEEEEEDLEADPSPSMRAGNS